MPNYLGQLLVIDPKQTLDFLLNKYGRSQQTKVIEECMNIIKDQMEEEEEDCSDAGAGGTSSASNKELLIFLLLDEVFNRGDLDVGREFHPQLVELYCKYNKAKLLKFLSLAEAYSPG